MIKELELQITNWFISLNQTMTPFTLKEHILLIQKQFEQFLWP
jgi:hypothetical protein